MKILLTLIFIFLIPLSTLIGQTGSAQPAEIENLFANKKFGATWSYYQNLLKTDSTNINLNYKMGICYLNSRSQKEKAVACFKKALAASTKEIDTSVVTYKLLADAAYQTFNFDLAILNYEKYKKILLSTKGSSPASIEETNRQIEMSKMGKELKDLKELVATLINHKFVSTGKNSSSPYLDYTTAASADNSTLTFTFKRPHTIENLYSDKNYFEDNDVFYSADILQSQNTDTSRIKKEATIATSVDGQIMLFYRNDNGDGAIYASNLTGNEWTVPEKLNKISNTKGWEPNEFISANGNTLYFTSTREGGLGGKDIYKSIKLPNGEWSKAINLGYPINTPYDDEAPFVHPDEVTLYFSSNRYNKNGNFDVFTSSYIDSTGSWATPLNIGYPEHKISASDLPLQTETIKNNSDNEIKTSLTEKNNYIVTFINPKKNPLTLVKGKVLDKDGNMPAYIEITVTDNETGEVTGNYNSNNKTGQYLFILPPGKNNNVTYEAEGYLFHSENIDISKETSLYKIYKSVKLVPLQPGSIEILNNIFFENNEALLSSTSDVELNKLFNLLTLNPKLTIELSAFISEKPSENETKLAEAKIQALVNYLTEKGISKERVSGKLQNSKKAKKKKKDKEIAEETQPGKIEVKILEIK